ncbi:MAG TPA: rod shape-determining protein MreD [Chitinispirillaceae bacterium]|nr:rod shape-determining protein MreD [Chitinispirillaceae bacterium]
MIKTVIKWVVIFFLVFVLQTTIIPTISIFGIKPDLLFLALFMLAVKTGIMPGLYVGFFLGLAQDIYSPVILGQNALSKTLAGFFAGLFNEKVMRLDPLIQTVLLVFTIILGDTVFLLIQIAKSGGSIHMFSIELLTSSLPRAIYSLLFGIIPIFWEYFFQTRSKR